ncbi:unnamed protein product [Closterium sp. NIES-65]|nr:unnamed protein product [Closterium sp. NIES-65]
MLMFFLAFPLPSCGYCFDSALQPGGQPEVTRAPQGEQQARGPPGATGAPQREQQAGGQPGLTGSPQGEQQPGRQPGATGAPQGVQQSGGQPRVTQAPEGEQQAWGQPAATKASLREQPQVGQPGHSGGAPQGEQQPRGQPGVTGAPQGTQRPGGQPGATGGSQGEQRPGGELMDDLEQQLVEWSRRLELDTPMATAEEPEEDGEPSIPPSPCPRFPCDTCFHTFAMRGAAANHMRVCRAAEAERRAQALGSIPSLVETDTQERPTPRDFGDEAWAGVTSWEWEAFFSVEAVGGRTVRRIPQRAREIQVARQDSASLYLRAGPFVQSLESARGSRQGGPLSPFLFAFTQQQVMASVIREFRDILFLSYADNTYILGPAARILEAFGVLRERLEWVGLEVQAQKCRFWEREGGDVERALPLGMQRVEEGLTVVGVPIGEEDWEARQRQLAVEELQALRRSARDDATLARFTSLQGPGAGAWVLAVPAHSDLTFTMAEWGIAAGIRLGLPIQQLQVAGRCACGTAYVDPADPHHALRCKHQHGPSRVHDEVKFAVARISKASGGVVTMEDGVVLPGKRVDVAVRRPMAGEAHAIEISVVDPLSLSPSLLGQCGRSIGVAAREWERPKMTDYAPLLARNQGVKFTPLIVETWGCLGGRFRPWLRRQGDAHVGLAVLRGACREDDFSFSAYLLGSLKALIGVALQRAQAHGILLRAASSMGGMNVDLVDREKDDVEEEGGALWVEAPYMVDAQM